MNEDPGRETVSAMVMAASETDVGADVTFSAAEKITTAAATVSTLLDLILKYADGKPS